MIIKNYKFKVGSRVVVTDDTIFNNYVCVGDTASIVYVANVCCGSVYVLWFDKKFSTVDKSQIVFVNSASRFIKPLRSLK